jgi:NADPH:quinone reductase-like Zn-dependent oxidoreductase
MQNKRVVITALGGPEALQVVNDEVGDPGPGEVRVRIAASGVAFADVLMRYGLYSPVPALPYSPGYDIVGEVESVGSGVTQWAAGDDVAAITRVGGYSQFINLPESELFRVPPGVDSAEAVSVVLNYVTAYQLIHRIAKLGEGDSMLIHGAAGGVGTAALQLGRIAGLKMFGTASRSKHALVESFGGIPIDYKTEDFVERARGVDAVFDPIGGMNWWRSYRTLGHGGRLVAYGMSTAVEGGKRHMLRAGASFALLGALGVFPGKSARWFNVMVEKEKHPDSFREDLTRLLEMLAVKSIQPLVAARLPLADAPKAHQMLEHASVSGKIVLMCQQ